MNGPSTSYTGIKHPVDPPYVAGMFEPMTG